MSLLPKPKVALIFGYSVTVALSVRQFIWQRESGSSQLLQVMGVRYLAIWLSNLALLAGIVLLNSSLLTLILCFGRLLPFSNPVIVFLLLNMFGLSVSIFIFLLSVVMKAASTGAVAAFLLFILTFLPFVVIISLSEQVLSYFLPVKSCQTLCERLSFDNLLRPPWPCSCCPTCSCRVASAGACST